MNRPVPGFAAALPAGLALILSACGASTASQVPISRPVAERPVPSDPPQVQLPAAELRRLSNGLEVWIVERHNAPLVVARLVVKSGSAAEAPAKAGLASLTGEMLRWGTATRSGADLIDELDYLAVGFGVAVGFDASIINVNSLVQFLPRALALYSDMLLNSTFPEHEFERVRRERLTSIATAEEAPWGRVGAEFGRLVYGSAHPYGRLTSGTAETVSGLTIEDVREFHRTHYRPNNAAIVVTGAISADEIVPMLEEAFRDWQPGDVPAVPVPTPPPFPDATRIHVVNRPGASQSTIQVGHPGVSRDSPDYFPLQLLQSILGGSFTSRISQNLRHEKGYTYGAGARFEMWPMAGSFLAGAAVQTEVTREALVELMKEIEEIRGARPVTEEELATAKAAITSREPLTLQTLAQLQGRYEELVQNGLPADYFLTYGERLNAVSLTDVQRAAREYLHPHRTTIVIDGDWAAIGARLADLPYPTMLVP
jgi:zinc protease